MSEEQEAVVEEVVVDAQQEEHSQEHQATESVSREDTQDRNWREARQLMRENGNVIDSLKYRLDASEAEITRLRQAALPKEPEQVFTDEDISTVGMTKQLLRKQEKQIEELRKDMKRREALTVEDRMRSKYADYDSVVSEDNLKRLYSTAPELVKMLTANQDDPYNQSLAAYKLIKKFGVKAEDSEKFEENKSKPRSVNSVGQTSALSQANAFSRGLTPDLRKQLFTEMNEAAKKA